MVIDQNDDILDRQPPQPSAGRDERQPPEPCLECERHPLLLDPFLVFMDDHPQLPGVAHIGGRTVVRDRLDSLQKPRS